MEDFNIDGDNDYVDDDYVDDDYVDDDYIDYRMDENELLDEYLASERAGGVNEYQETDDPIDKLRNEIIVFIKKINHISKGFITQENKNKILEKITRSPQEEEKEDTDQTLISLINKEIKNDNILDHPLQKNPIAYIFGFKVVKFNPKINKDFLKKINKDFGGFLKENYVTIQDVLRYSRLWLKMSL
jgi:hypothetical protein